MNEKPAEPLYNLIRQTRRPATLRQIMAVCVRHIYMGDPTSAAPGVLPVTPRELMENVHAADLMVDQIRCVVYKPGTPSRGLLLYMHGGGFVFGSSEDTDYITRNLCQQTSLTVISINYRLAPETTFPGAADDCVRVHEWALSKSDELGFDSGAVFLAGDSAGGNLAASLSLRLHEQNTSVRGSILLAPWLDMNMEKYESYNRLAPDGIVYDAPFMGFARAAYARYDQWCDPLVSPFYADANKFPKTIILIGTDDPLVDQSIQFAERMKAAGKNQFELVTYPGMPHCFYSLPGLFTEEADCYARIRKFVGDLL